MAEQKPTKKRRIDWPGQQRFNSLREAFDHTNKTMSQIHTQDLKPKAANGR
jgi:hypothetical protein